MITDREKAILALIFKGNPCCDCCSGDDDYKDRARAVVVLFDRQEWAELDLPVPTPSANARAQHREQQLRDVYVFGPPAAPPTIERYLCCGGCMRFVDAAGTRCTGCEALSRQ
jgi:hypothetical protein